MSKLFKAMERADLERGKRPPLMRDLKSSGPRAEVSIGSFDYTETKVAPVDCAYLEEHRVVTPACDVKLADAYRLLRTRVLQLTKPRRFNSLMITSVGPGEGKTLTAINLSLSLAREAKQTALLVDANFRSPKVAEYLGLGNTPGLYEYFTGENPVSEYLVNPGQDKIVVLPAGNPEPGAVEMIGSPRMSELSRELKARYPDRYVIYDLPHLLNMSDALVFSAHVDAVILVVELGKTRKDDIAQAVELLRERNLIGVVANATH